MWRFFTHACLACASCIVAKPSEYNRLQGTVTDDSADTPSVWSGGSVDSVVGDSPGGSVYFSVGSAASRCDSTEAGINSNHDEGNNVSLKTRHKSGDSRVSEISGYSEPSEEKGTKWGFTLIINMINFPEGGLERRDGAEYDDEAVQTFFEKFGSQVVTARDMSKEKLMEMLATYSRADHSNYCYFLCFIMSHGSEEGIYCSDGELVSIAEIVDKFRSSKCPSLEGKPKTFVMDACLGSKLQSKCRAVTNLFIYIG
ncbi:caspase-8-like [Lingula anatina]|uniref:Caspase-8-like n=1 Tax=Lingula anatina TaxID=7574 RepID=A0A2R2ML94_LINAN|nr:caspase-8-like [Lingula anatina]|eukprot:XP_023930969.1 caspase-8-like [Lingula anatina]